MPVRRVGDAKEAVVGLSGFVDHLNKDASVFQDHECSCCRCTHSHILKTGGLGERQMTAMRDLTFRTQVKNEPLAL
jgi:hypothetical protein